MLRYELCKEQNFKCIYCYAGIAPDGFSANDTRYQVDHILPWSRFGDDFLSQQDALLHRLQSGQARPHAVRMVRRRQDAGEWDAFVARVEGFKEMKGLKKRNFKLKDADDVEEKFKARNLTDTQWATRLLADRTRTNVSARKAKERRVRPGLARSPRNCGAPGASKD